jgi:hypothetical protein
MDYDKPKPVNVDDLLERAMRCTEVVGITPMPDSRPLQCEQDGTYQCASCGRRVCYNHVHIRSSGSLAPSDMPYCGTCYHPMKGK